MWNQLLTESTRLFDEFDWLTREMDRLFEPMGVPGLRSDSPSGYPTINVASEEDKVHVLVFAPGIQSDQLEVQVQGNVLSISGKRDDVGGDDDARVWADERFAGEFRRVVTLPDDVDPNRIEAQSRDGVLWIQVGRSEAARPRKIQVH
jgi:HSP20 family protein